jgi:hypothetical protein
MAFEGEYDDFQPEKKPKYGPITSWDSNPLFTFFAQIASALILLIEWGIALAMLPLFIAYMPPTGPVDPVGVVIMTLFVPLGAFQMYLGYRLYKRVPNTLKLAFIGAIWVILMSVTIIITSFLTGTGASIQLPVIQIAVNVVLVYLSRLNDVKEHFDGVGAHQFL